MQLSREFVLLMGLVVHFLLAAFATEDARCVARARRVIERFYMPIPAAIAEAEVRAGLEPVRFASLDASVPPPRCLRPAERGR
jgi:hypothetical protein